MKCKLLVAEDELIERKVLCRTLQKYLGDLICLYEAKNGREALEILAREAPQVKKTINKKEKKTDNESVKNDIVAEVEEKTDGNVE